MKLKSKKYIYCEEKVYDLTVENTHSYNVSGLAVHNSSAGSLVAYLTGITDVDPIEYDLIFERFHNNKKKSFPDIDTDFSKPGLVKEYIKERYGSDRVASISNWSKLSPKVIIKDVARSLRLGGDKSAAFKIANSITDSMGDEPTIEEEKKKNKTFSAYMDHNPELFLYSSKLQNLTRNWSVHAAGVVIGEEPLSKIIPLRIEDKKDTGESLVVTQWEKSRCEDNGLIKMDLLGLKTLTVIDNAFNLIKKRTGKDLTVNDINLSDPLVYNMIGRGSTSGVFQLESSLTPLCMKLKPENIEDISVINAIGRPSCQPAERNKYIDRRLGSEQAEFLHESTKRALAKTYGVLVYEEQAMFLAQDCAGWDLNQADALRKISKMKGKDPELVLRTEKSFVEDCVKNTGMDWSVASDIWTTFIEPLNLYAFNKSLHYLEEVRIMRNEEELILPIKEVKSNDYVLSRNEETKEDIQIMVKDNHYHGKLPVFKITLYSGEEVTCTKNHKFRTSTGEMLPLWEILEYDLEIVTKNIDGVKIKLIEYVGEHDTYDLEVEHSDHQYYLANGVLTSNSHSISYSHISFYTAWLRYYYPSEFMCSLLNSEDPNSEKSQEYLNECKNMNIDILPPSVNSSGDYTIEKNGVILTGLGAMKGVGDSAIQNIAENTPYQNLEEFLGKTEGRVVNKRVIQSLAKAGGFDPFKVPRKVIHDDYAKMRTKINTYFNKHKKIWEKSYLDDAQRKGEAAPSKEHLGELSSSWLSSNKNNLLKTIPKIKFDVSDGSEWTKKEILVNEQEVLGRTISGSLHEVFAGFFKGGSSMATPFSNIINIRPRTKIRIEAIVKSKVKEFKIKNGKNAGQKFAKYIIEDSHGDTTTMTLWADDYSKYKLALTDGTPIKAVCSVNEYQGSKDLALSTLERAFGKSI